MHFSTLKISTRDRRELHDITEDVATIINNAKIQDGAALIFAQHTTCAVIISEREDGLEKDFLNYIEKEGPKGPYSHTHGGNSHTPSHILSSIIGQSVQIPIQKNQMQLGTWQRICFLELDGPRDREIIVQFLQ